MGSLIVYCHYCNAKLDVDDSWLGKELQCPVCHRLIAIKNNDLPEPPEMPDVPDFSEFPGAPEPVDNKKNLQADQKKNVGGSLRENTPPLRHKRYFLGHLGVASAKFLAVLLLLSGGYFSWDLISMYHYRINLMPEKLQMDAACKELQNQEKELNKELINTVTLLSGGGVIRNGELDGIRLAPDAVKRPGVMQCNIDSREDVLDAQEVLMQYRKIADNLKKAFVESFGRLLDSIVPQSHPASGRKYEQSNITVTTGGDQRKFYASEVQKKRQAAELLILLKSLLNHTQQDSTAARRINARGLQQSMAAARFVERRLFPSTSSTTVVRGSQRALPGADPASARRDKLGDEVLGICSVIADLSGDWQLDRQIDQLENILKNISACQSIFENKRSQLQRELSGALIRLWLSVLASAFALMVTADFLRAHFEVAELLHDKLDV